MPNYCNFDLQATARSKEGLEALVNALTATYDYSRNEKGEFNNYPAHPHFYRVFRFDYTYDEVGTDKDDKTYFLTGSGDCAWSVSSCMMNGTFSYLNRKNENFYNDTHLEELAEKYPDLRIEILSEELGMGFSERIVLEDGFLKVDQCEDLEIFYLDNMEDLFELIENYSDFKVVKQIKVEYPELQSYIGDNTLDQITKEDSNRYKKIKGILDQLPSILLLEAPEWIQSDGENYCFVF